MKLDLLEIIFYLSIAALLAWIILKGLGVIQSPVWVEMIPYASLGFAFGAGFTKIKNMLDGIIRDLSEIKTEHRGLLNRFNKLETEHRFITKGMGH